MRASIGDPLKPQLITADHQAELHLAVVESPARRALDPDVLCWILNVECRRNEREKSRLIVWVAVPLVRWPARSRPSAPQRAQRGAVPVPRARGQLTDPGRDYIFLVGPARNDLEGIIGQRSLQCFGPIPRRTHPHVAFLGRVRITGIAFGWIGSTIAFGAAVRKP